MKLFFCFAGLLAASAAFSQTQQQSSLRVDSPEYKQLKAQGLLRPESPSHTRFTVDASRAASAFPVVDTVSGAPCSCLVPLDTTFSVVPFMFATPPEYRSDDGYTYPISLPFNFCFYGQQINSFYINSNGNISFGAPYATFSAMAFPNSDFTMIAPFWADVDTQDPQSGLVYYKITPTALIVRWDSVGYFNSHSDKRNTFQLIITNGADSLVPGGNNVEFCYGDMQWTTGDASNGVYGFGGLPAVAGINAGDAIHYMQIGEFNLAGSAYDGAYNGDDGVDFLDHQRIITSTCSATNIPPIAVDTLCDTIPVYVGTTMQFNTRFLAPENNENTTVSVSAPGVTGYTVLSNNSGCAAKVTQQFDALPANVGYNTIWYTATDNGSPSMTRTFKKTFLVMWSPNSIAEPASPDELVTVAPNPSSGGFHIQLPALQELREIRLTDVSGKLLFRSQQVADVPELPPGIYLLFVQTQSGSQVLKLIAQ